MVQIEDCDSPIIAAEKIIHGTKNPSKFQKSLLEKNSIAKAFFGDISIFYDMFTLEDIKEIAEYLEVYYNSHIDGD